MVLSKPLLKIWNAPLPSLARQFFVFVRLPSLSSTPKRVLDSYKRLASGRSARDDCLAEMPGIRKTSAKCREKLVECSNEYYFSRNEADVLRMPQVPRLSERWFFPFAGDKEASNAIITENFSTFFFQVQFFFLVVTSLPGQWSSLTTTS